MTEFLHRSTWSVADRVVALLVVMALFATPYAGKLEGLLFPVADDFGIDRTLQTPDGVRIWGHVTVERPSCNFVRIEWFLVGQERQTQVPLNLEEGPKLRPSGVSEFGPWLIDVPEYALGQTRATVYHQCPYRPWLTETPLFP